MKGGIGMENDRLGWVGIGWEAGVSVVQVGI